MRCRVIYTFPGIRYGNEIEKNDGNTLFHRARESSNRLKMAAIPEFCERTPSFCMGFTVGQKCGFAKCAK